MSEESVDQSIQPNTTQSSETGDNKNRASETPQDEYARKLSDLSAENKKFRQTYAQYKRELEETRDQLRQAQEASMQEQGKFKDLYEKTSKELQSEREVRNKDRAQWTGHVVASRFAAEAVKAGCQDPVALIKIANADGMLSQSDLISEDTFEVNQDALSSVVQQAKKQNQILFGKPTPAPKDGVPRTQNTTITQQDLNSMKMDDLLAMAKRFN
jgi:hypothetical protein